jgi:uncharacterized membrane protein
MDRLAAARLTRIMSTTPVAVLTATAAVASAVVAGVFFAFSTFVMRGLDRTDPLDALTAMRGINAEAQANAPFLMMFLGSAVLALAVGVVAVVRLDQPNGWILLAGAVFGVAGLVVTMAFNIPLNDRLAALDPAALSAGDAAQQWQSYLTAWTAWNHVRTATGVLAAALLVVGLRG